MNGVQDMGGMDNFGPIVIEENEPAFHDDWERTMFSLVLALLPVGKFNVDEIRRITELIPPVTYLNVSYFEKWLISTENILLEKGLLSPGELKTGKSDGTGEGSVEPAAREVMEYAMSNPMPANLDIQIDPKFKEGDLIITRNIHPLNHTRIPRYVRGKQGRVEQDHGVFLLPDTNAHGGPEKPQHVYTVRFDASELWGDEASARDAVYIDLFDDYMEHRK